MNKLLTIKNFILKTPNYLFKIIMKALFFPFKVIIEFVDIILTEIGNITFREIVKFVLVSIIVNFGKTILRLIIGFILICAGVKL